MPDSRGPRGFCWAFTLNNPTDFLKPEEWLDCTYMVYNQEIAPETGTPHFQGYAQFSKRKRVTQLKKFEPRAHFISPNGTPEQNRTYCTKHESRYPGTEPIEWGTIDLHAGIGGTRTDIHDAFEWVVAAEAQEAVYEYDFAREHTSVWCRYPTFLARVACLAAAERLRREVAEAEEAGGIEPDSVLPYWVYLPTRQEQAQHPRARFGDPTGPAIDGPIEAGPQRIGVERSLQAPDEEGPGGDPARRDGGDGGDRRAGGVRPGGELAGPDPKRARRNCRSGTRVTVIVHLGRAGYGKSHFLDRRLGYAYWKSPGKWWDGYYGQRRVVLNDLGDGGFDCPDLLRLFEPYAYRVEVKGSTVEIPALEFHISTNFHPHFWFKDYFQTHPEHKEALERRITEVWQYYPNGYIAKKSGVEFFHPALQYDAALSKWVLPHPDLAPYPGYSVPDWVNKPYRVTDEDAYGVPYLLPQSPKVRIPFVEE